MSNANSSQYPHPESEPGRSGGPSGQNQGPEAGYQIFDWVRSTGMRRPTNGWVGGVIAGVAEKLGWDAVLVRGLSIVAFILFFSPTALLYGLAWLLLPDEKGRIHAQQAVRGQYNSGFFAGVIIAGIGAINVFTPNIAGWFAFVVNVAILGVIAWVVYLLIRNYAKRSPSGPSRPRRGPSSTPGTDSSSSDQQQEPSGPQRPPWYPKEGPAYPMRSTPTPSPSASQHGPTTPPPNTGHTPPSAAYAQQTPPPGYTTAVAAPPRETAEERASKRRRRMLTFGLLLLAVPLVVAGIWVAAVLGVPLTAGALGILAGLVIALAVTHIGSALRGRRGRTGLLVVFTALMLVLFAGHSASVNSSNSVQVFSSQSSGTDQDVATAFSNTTVDLRDIRQQEAAEQGEDPEDPDFEYQTELMVSSAFGNTTIIVPDDAVVILHNTQALGNLDVRTQDATESARGFSDRSIEVSPSDPETANGTIEIDLNAAFGNVSLYDATTYAERGETDTDGSTDGDDTEDNGAQGRLMINNDSEEDNR